MFWNSTHINQCSCKWCSLDIERVRATGTNAPKDSFYLITKEHFISHEVQGQPGSNKHLTEKHSHEYTLTRKDASTHASQSPYHEKDLLNSTHTLENNNVSSIDIFNDSIWDTTELTADTDLWLAINHLTSSTSTSELSLNTSGSLLSVSTSTNWETDSNYSLQTIEGASKETVEQQLISVNSSDKVTETQTGAKNNKLHEQWGFIPCTFFSAIVDCGSQSIDHSDMTNWIKLAHSTASEHNVPNYLGARVKVVSQLDVRQWRHLLATYQFNRVCDYIEFGFPLSLDYKDFKYNTIVDNHPSASQFPEAVNDYLQTEIAYNAIVGPFDASPFEKLHVSPMMTRPKPDGSRRIIVDMSWPQGDSVNSHIPDKVFDDMTFQLKYPTVDNIVTQISVIGPTALLYKIDLKRAYRNLRTDPRDFTVLGLLWQGKRYVDVSVAFGIKSGASACQMVTDCVTYLMTSQDHWTCAYLDDIIGVSEPSKANNAFTSLSNLIRTLGLPVNPDKVVAPTHQMTCLGINIDAKTATLTIPMEKIKQVKRLCDQWASKAYGTRRSIQRLLGHLIYLHRCVTPSRLFVNRILQVLRVAPPQGRISLDANFFKDINWFRRFLDSFNGVTRIHSDVSAYRNLYVDASLQGIGAYTEQKVYWSAIPECYKSALSIVHYEMLNVMVAFRVWGPQWEDTKVKVFCDNAAVVSILNSGRTKDSFLSACARTLWLIQARYNIKVCVQHIQGSKNIYADILSRWFHFQSIDNENVAHLKKCEWFKVDIDALQPDFSI